MGSSVISKMQRSLLGTRTLVRLAAVASVALAACSSNSNTSTQVSLAMPDWNSFTRTRSQNTSAATTYTLSRLMINVTGGALPTPMIKLWDANQINATASPPTSFSFSVAKGGTGLVQVLAILSPSSASSSTGSNSGSVILYGDQAQAFDSDNVSVSVNLNVVSQAAGSADGVIAGRYLRADGLTGPTGFVDIKYVPNDGAPAMIVTTSEIHGGWFEFPAFESLNFTYTLRGVSDLISNFNLDSTSLLSGKQNMMVSIPTSYQSNNGTSLAQNPVKLQLGYYGPGVTVQSICYDSLTADSIPYIYSDAAGDPMSWSGTGLPTAAQAGVTAGGQSAANANCLLPATQKVTWLRFDQTVLQGGGQRPLGFHGPFDTQSDGSLIDVSAPDASHLNLNFTLLPGTVGTGRVTGIGVFTRDLSTAAASNNGNKDYQIDDGIACNRLTDSSFLTQTFTLQSRVPISAAGNQLISIGGVPSVDFAAGKLQVILCPYSDLQPLYYNLAADAGGSSVSGSDDMSITSPTGSLTQLSTICTPYQINNVVNGVISQASSPQAFTLSVGNSTTATLSNNCMNGSATFSGLIPAGSSSTTVYLADSGQQFDTLNLNITASGYGRSLQIAVAKTSDSAALALTMPIATVDGSYNLATNLCYPIDVELTSSGLPVVPSTGALTYGLTIGDTSSALYKDSTCRTPLSPASVVFTPTSGYTRIYLKSTGVATSSNVQAMQSPFVSGYPTGGNLSFTMADSSTATLSASLFNSSGSATPLTFYPSNSCQQIQLNYIASNGAPAPAPSRQTLSISATGGVTFYTKSCPSTPAGSGNSSTTTGSSSTTTLIYPSNQPNAIASQPIYAKFGNSSASTFTFGPAGANPSTVTFYQQPSTIALVSPQTSKFVRSQCSPMLLNYSSGIPIPTTVNFASSDASFYVDPYCKTYSNSLVVPANHTSTPVYMMDSLSSTSPTVTLAGSTLSSSTTVTSPTFTLTPSLGAVSTGMVPNALSANTCYEFFLSNPTTTTSVTLALKDTSNLTAVNGNYFYQNSSCSTSLSTSATSLTTTTIGVTANSNLSTWYVKTGVTAPTSIPINISDADTGLNFNWQAVFSNP